MRITVGTFNLNNLFSRFNFSAQVDAIKKNDTGVNSKVTYKFTEDDVYRLRTFKGRLVQQKDKKERQVIAGRVKAMDVDVLGVQEVENIDILKTFNFQDLGGLYPYYTLIEGNDPRLIDVGVLSKYPIGQVTTWHQAVHEEEPDETVFGRDLLQVEILNATRRRTLFTLFNTHLKSHFVDFRDDPVKGKKKNDARRRRQAETIQRILDDTMRPNSRCILLGDMNDPPEAAPLRAFGKSEVGLVNALTNPVETRPPKADTPMPPNASWTHRFKPSGKPAEYHLYDHIWLSRALAPRQTAATIDRRKKHGGDGSDHDPAWIELDL